MRPYCADVKDLRYTQYQLFAIINHRGGLHGKLWRGHVG
jgi:hypothetical protein